MCLSRNECVASNLSNLKAMASHSSTLAWKIPQREERARLQSESDTTERLHFHFLLFTFMHWRRKWQPTPVFLPGESQGWQSLVGCRLWGRTGSDTTERLHFHFHFSLSCIGEGNGTPLQCPCLENPGTAEPGGLPSMGSHRVGHDCSDSAARP